METQEKEVTRKGPMTSEEWTANMPSYVMNSTPYKVPLKTEKAITAKAMTMSNAMKAF
jgi:hypothetical protein